MSCVSSCCPGLTHTHGNLQVGPLTNPRHISCEPFPRQEETKRLREISRKDAMTKRPWRCSRCATLGFRFLVGGSCVSFVLLFEKRDRRCQSDQREPCEKGYTNMPLPQQTATSLLVSVYADIDNTAVCRNIYIYIYILRHALKKQYHIYIYIYTHVNTHTHTGRLNPPRPRGIHSTASLSEVFRRHDDRRDLRGFPQLHGAFDAPRRETPPAGPWGGPREGPGEERGQFLGCRTKANATHPSY